LLDGHAPRDLNVTTHYYGKAQETRRRTQVHEGYAPIIGFSIVIGFVNIHVLTSLVNSQEMEEK
jgi:hypothetical protein